MPSRGLILFAHGARDPRWAAPFEAVAARLATHAPDLRVRLAFLELMEPDLPAAAASLVAEGCTEITVLPMFLGAGGHVRRDLPLLLEGLRVAHPNVSIVSTAALGEMPSMLDAMALTIANALGNPHGASA